jgi:hypothetical protein
MPAPDWPRFEAGDARPEAEAQDLARQMARVFSTGDGPRVLAHLRAMTLERCLGPDAKAKALRHLEGQRQLVLYIQSMVKRAERE